MILFYSYMVLTISFAYCEKWIDHYDLLKDLDNDLKIDVRENEANVHDPSDKIGHSDSTVTPVEVIVQEKNLDVNNEHMCNENNDSKEKVDSDCSSLLLDLIYYINQQLPVKIDDKNHEATLELYLTPSDIESLKLFSPPSQIKPSELCSILQESFVRASQRTIYVKSYGIVRHLYFMILNGIYEGFQYQSYGSMTISLKGFINIQIFFIFLTSVFIFFKYRSVVKLFIWIMLCFFFLTLSTSYEHMYQQALSEREATIARLGHKIPDHCSKSSINFWNSFWHGSTDCKEFFLSYNLQPEVTIKFTDIIVDVFSNIFIRTVTNTFESCCELSSKLIGDSYYERWILKPVIALFFILLFFYLFFQLLHIYLNNLKKDPHFIIHRDSVQHIQSSNPGPAINAGMSAELIHNLLELKEKSVKEKIVENVIESLSDRALMHGKKKKDTFQRLKSTNAIKESTSKENMSALDNRRLSL